MKRKLLAGVFVLAGAVFTGCAGGYSYGYVSYAPPAPQYGVVGVAPGPGFVWTEGYWGWQGGRYAWVPGRWARPPRARAAWVAPEWRHEGRGWRFHQGHWR
ncbi:MAG: YXWGXW repeat-containing protein [Acidobacteriia bacterium]|nr:YXWGXW repeat-containing protein [Terriglobia bacterium]